MNFRNAALLFVSLWLFVDAEMELQQQTLLSKSLADVPLNRTILIRWHPLNDTSKRYHFLAVLVRKPGNFEEYADKWIVSYVDGPAKDKLAVLPDIPKLVVYDVGTDPDKYVDPDSLVEFTDAMHCPVCLSFVSALRGQMLRLQPASWMSPRERQAYLRREDRLMEIVEEAVSLTARDYIWSLEDHGKARYWHISVLRKSKVVSSALLGEIDQQRMRGGNIAMRKFLQMTLLDEEKEEVLEDLARKNVTDLTVLRQRVCVTGLTPICKGLNLQDMVPKDAEFQAEEGENKDTQEEKDL